MEFLDKLGQPVVVIGILALVILELVKARRTEAVRRRDQNGGNVVVQAIKEAAKEQCAAIEKDGRATRDAFQGFDRRMAEHEDREERKWEDVDRSIRALREG